MLESQNKRTILEIEKGSTEGNFRSSNATAWMLKIPKRIQQYQQLTRGL